MRSPTLAPWLFVRGSSHQVTRAFIESQGWIAISSGPKPRHPNLFLSTNQTSRTLRARQSPPSKVLHPPDRDKQHSIAGTTSTSDSAALNSLAPGPKAINGTAFRVCSWVAASSTLPWSLLTTTVK